MTSKYSKDSQTSRKIDYIVHSIQQDKELSSLMDDLTQQQYQNTLLQAQPFENRLGPLMTFRLKSTTTTADDYDDDDEEVRIDKDIF